MAFAQALEITWLRRIFQNESKWHLLIKKFVVIENILCCVSEYTESVLRNFEKYFWKDVFKSCIKSSAPVKCGERGGSVVESRTPEREVGGSRPTAAVMCPWARHFTPRKYWLITQEAVAPSRHDWKIVDWDVKPQHKQTNQLNVGWDKYSPYQTPIFCNKNLLVGDTSFFSKSWLDKGMCYIRDLMDSWGNFLATSINTNFLQYQGVIKCFK